MHLALAELAAVFDVRPGQSGCAPRTLIKRPGRFTARNRAHKDRPKNQKMSTAGLVNAINKRCAAVSVACPAGPLRRGRLSGRRRASGPGRPDPVRPRLIWRSLTARLQAAARTPPDGVSVPNGHRTRLAGRRCSSIRAAARRVLLSARRRDATHHRHDAFARTEARMFWTRSGHPLPGEGAGPRFNRAAAMAWTVPSVRRCRSSIVGLRCEANVPGRSTG